LRYSVSAKRRKATPAGAQLVELQRPFALHFLGMVGRLADRLGEDVESFGEVPGEELRAQPEAVAPGVAADGAAHRFHLAHQALRSARPGALGDEAREQHVDARVRRILGAQPAVPRRPQRDQRHRALLLDEQHSSAGKVLAQERSGARLQRELHRRALLGRRRAARLPGRQRAGGVLQDVL
jgi:hypothetical protein